MLLIRFANAIGSLRKCCWFASHMLLIRFAKWCWLAVTGWIFVPDWPAIAWKEKQC